MKEYVVRVYNDKTEWYQNGELHREDGAAIEYVGGSKFWFLNGDNYTEKQFRKETKKIQKPKKLPTYKNWYPESGNIKCVCGELIWIRSTYKRHDEIKCKKCDLVYEFWNNKDGSGLRFNVKGYFPFYSSGYKFTIEQNYY